ncbi:hypothetical protein V6N11_009686 [Hibiscus sabdariffa]|uniref:F-box associated beta-propeller type 1 domain-containing protein n=1 Tax=Hibiscus sabdariffa TaxID=183260 RepID=A0ABR2P653_9ROSI
MDDGVPHDLIVNILEKLAVKSLMRFNGDHGVCVYNHAAWEYRLLPKDLRDHCLGFGRDSITKRYRIVILFNDDPAGLVFTLDPNPNACWKTIGAVPYKIKVGSDSVYVNGAIYWFTDHQVKIIMFDLHTEKFEPIPHPNHCWDKEEICMQLENLRERLCLAQLEPDNKLNIWIMQQQHKKKITWEKLYCIQHVALDDDLRFPRFALAEREDGTLLVCINCDVYLCKQNDMIRCGPPRHFSVPFHLGVAFGTTSFTESIVPVYGTSLNRFRLVTQFIRVALLRE